MLMATTAYVLGAGSSVCTGGPLISGFKEAALRVANTMSAGDSRSRMISALANWEDMAPASNVEEYYILVDLLHRLGPSASGDSLGTKRVEDAKYLIAKTLQVAMGTGVSRTHAEFRQEVVAAPRRDGIVISLNWDIAYDRAVMSAYGPLSLDYGYTNAKPTTGEEQGAQQARFSLYKLHGSSNWWFCTTCHTLWYSVDKKATVTHWEAYERQACKTDRCTGTLLPFMIPPTSQKFESSEFFRPLTDIWGKARGELAKCSEVFFVGYSFPPTDVQFKMLAVEALSSNRFLKTVAVVTSPKFGSERAEFEDHYSSVLSDPRLKNKLKFKYATFEDWVEKDRGSFLEHARLD